MGILQAFINLSLGIAVLILLFFVAWYIAVPLILFFIIFAFVGYVRNKIFLYNAQKKMADQYKKRRSQSDAENNIIDVDYTEV